MSPVSLRQTYFEIILVNFRESKKEVDSYELDGIQSEFILFVELKEENEFCSLTVFETNVIFHFKVYKLRTRLMIFKFYLILL